MILNTKEKIELVIYGIASIALMIFIFYILTILTLLVNTIIITHG